MNTIICKLEDIKTVAEQLIPYIKEGRHVLLNGGLGAGKTTLTSTIIKLITEEDIEVSSPTYSIVQEYETSLGVICHMDLYRIEDEDELLDIGFEDILYRNTCIIEWPEIGMNFVENAIEVNITQVNSDERTYEFAFID